MKAVRSLTHLLPIAIFIIFCSNARVGSLDVLSLVSTFVLIPFICNSLFLNRSRMAQSMWQQQANDGSWPPPGFGVTCVQPEHIETQNNNKSNVTHYPTIPSNPESITVHHPIQGNSDSIQLDQNIVALLPFVGSAAKHCILQFLRQSISQSSSMSSSYPNDFILSDLDVQATAKDGLTAPPTELYEVTNSAMSSDSNNNSNNLYQCAASVDHQSFPSNFGYSDQYNDNVNQISHYPDYFPISDQAMLSPGFSKFTNEAVEDSSQLVNPTNIGCTGIASTTDQAMLSPTSDRLSDPSAEGDCTQFMNSIKATKDISHRVTHPIENINHSDTYNQLASSKHNSAPPVKVRRPLGEFSMSSGTPLICRDCNTPVKRKGDLKRHQDTKCPANPDRINYTCLLHSGPGRVIRPDKIRRHLLDQHELNWTFEEIRAWLWPFAWRGQTQGWACDLCDDAPLGMWPRDREKIETHIEACKKGEMARASRYPDGWIGDNMEEMLITKTKRMSVEELKQSYGTATCDEDEEADSLF